MSIDRVRVINAGSPGGAASTNFYFFIADTTNLTALTAFLNAIKAYIPSTMTMQVPNTGDTVNETTGQLAGSWTATGGSNVVGTGTGIQSTPTGFEVAWLTDTVIDGHRPVGKTLIVPASASAYSGTGVISSSVVTAVNAAAATFVAAASQFIVWHRPVYNRDVDPPALIRPGSSVDVVSGICRSVPTVLRSRRS